MHFLFPPPALQSLFQLLYNIILDLVERNRKKMKNVLLHSEIYCLISLEKHRQCRQYIIWYRWGFLLFCFLFLLSLYLYLSVCMCVCVQKINWYEISYTYIIPVLQRLLQEGFYKLLVSQREMLFHNRKQNKKSYIIKNILFCELNFLFIVSDTCV